MGRSGWRGLTDEERRWYYDDTNLQCRDCGGDLTGRRTRFCSKECGNSFWNRRDWRAIRRAAFKRDNWTCQKCGTRYWPAFRGKLEGDHIVPVADGGDEFDLDNVRTLCVECHKAVTRAWRRNRANPVDLRQLRLIT